MIELFFDREDYTIIEYFKKMMCKLHGFVFKKLAKII
jgi:hypothetical protein